jgi:MHS family proline/betaine transporter-like MFS transporter
MRPLGSILFGYLGDQWGRKQALTLSIIFMAIPTLIIAILPTYAEIGIWATIILVLCRLMQGLCTGGEFTGASIYILEHSLPKRRGLVGGILVASSTFGALSATILGALVLSSNYANILWRLPFLIGAAVGLIGLYIRRQLDETPEFIQTNAMKETVPLKEIMKHHPNAIFSTIGIAAFGTVTSYALTVYMNIYLHHVLGFAIGQSMVYSSIGLGAYFFTSLITGYLSDYFGQKPVMLVMSLLGLISFYPMFSILATGNLTYIVVMQILLGIIAGGFCGPETTLMNHLFPVHYRYTGASFGYCMGLTIVGGGTFPLISSALIEWTGSIMAPAYYLITLGIVGFIAVLKSEEISKPNFFSI